MDAVANELGPGWCQAEIVRVLRDRNPRSFATLTPQVLGRYIERPKNETPRWKASFLLRVLQGHKPIANITRSGILVSCIPTSSSYGHHDSNRCFVVLAQISRTCQGYRRAAVPTSPRWCSHLRRHCSCNHPCVYRPCRSGSSRSCSRQGWKQVPLQ